MRVLPERKANERSKSKAISKSEFCAALEYCVLPASQVAATRDTIERCRKSQRLTPDTETQPRINILMGTKMILALYPKSNVMRRTTGPSWTIRSCAVGWLRRLHASKSVLEVNPSHKVRRHPVASIDPKWDLTGERITHLVGHKWGVYNCGISVRQRLALPTATMILDPGRGLDMIQRRFFLLILPLLLAICTCNSPSTRVQGPPELPPGVVLLRIEFTDRNGLPHQAGTAFGVEYPELSHAVVLTALHIFEPDRNPITIGPVEFKGKNLAGVVRSVSFYDATDQSQLMERRATVRDIATWRPRERPIKATQFLTPPGASLDGRGDPGDIAAFGVEGEFRSLRLNTHALGSREPVWLFAVLAQTTTPVLLRGVVEKFDNSQFWFRLDEPQSAEAFQATSGAPVLNGAGEVVGIHLGSNGASCRATDLSKAWPYIYPGKERLL